MHQFKIKLRKNAVIRTVVFRIVFYTMLLICSTFALYILDIFINRQNIKYPLFLIILIILALFFQYLIYAKSLGKRISLTNFKDTLMGLELENSIIYLFPEFELFYKLEDSIIDKIDIKKLLAINYINEENALKIETEFKKFISENLDELLEYDLVIKMKRKGKAIYDDLIDQFPPLEKLVQYTDPAVFFYMEKIKERKILIFDDSIHHSNSARKIIDSLKLIGYNKILFLTVIAQEDSLIALKRDYPDIKFLQYKIENENDYKKFYAEYMIGYLDHVNRSLENDHTIIKLKIDMCIKKDSFINLFTDTKNYIYEVERIVEKENEYKISLECPWIYDNMKKSAFKNIKMDMVKVRFFIKLNQPNDKNPYGTTDINLSPALIPHEFFQDFCNKPKTKESCLLNKFRLRTEVNINDELENLVCINCLINTLTNEFINDFMNYFETKLKEKNKATIVEKTIAYPYPQERYRLK
jgi:uracil phosphoribosyltransferase